MTKRWYTSKTIWFNILTGVVSLATLYGYRDNPEIAANVAVMAGAFAPVINMILRMVTSSAVR